MPIFKGTTEITKISDLLTATEHDIQWVYFGDKEVFTVWDTYEGALPAQFSANGDNLKAYKIWGNTGGVGKETENIYGGPLTVGYYAFADGSLVRSGDTAIKWGHTEMIPCDGEEPYAFKIVLISELMVRSCGFVFFDENKNFISSEQGVYKATAPLTAKYFAIDVSFMTRDYQQVNFDQSDIESFTVVNSSTIPRVNIPYGYKVDVETQENLFNKNDLRPNDTSLNEEGAMYTNGYCSVTPFIPINGGSTYEIRNADAAAFCWYNAEKQYISGERYDYRQQFTTTAPQNAAYIRCTVTNETSITTNRNIDTFMLTESGQETVTPIYIGTPALEKDEYIDSESGKAYRRTEQLVKGYRQGSSNTFERLTRVTSTNIIPAISGQSVSAKLYNAIEGYQFAIWGMNQAGAEEFETNGLVSTTNVMYDSGWKSPNFKCTDTNSVAYAITIRKAGDPAITPATVEGILGVGYGEIEIIPDTYTPYLQPTDPPVPLPTIPTVDGTTIVEVDSTVQPERVELNYRKHNF